MSSHALPSRRDLQARARHEAAAGSRGRGRHVSGRGEGFGRLLGWTTAGAVLPGLGFLGAGRRGLAALCLGVIAVVTAGLAYLYATGRLLDLGLQLAVRPSALLVIALLAVAVGLVWAAVIISGHRALRRVPLRPDQNVLSFVLVTALVAAVLVPAATVSRYALAQRSVVINVFGESGDRDGSLAAPTEGADPWAGTPRVNVLLIGSDAGADRKGIRPDTLMLASIDTATGDTVMFSLPRNLQNVPFPPGTPAAKVWPNGYNCGDDCLLNAIWHWAEAERPDLFPGDPNPGLTATRQAVSATLGVPVDYYAMVNLQGFQDLVNAMGGLEITVQKRVPVQSTVDYDRGRKPERWIEPGHRVLNGEDALWFARSRAGSTDYERMRRQQCVIGAATTQMDPVSLALAFPQLAASAERNVATDIPQDHLQAFVELAQRVKNGTVRSLPFTDQVIRPARPDFTAIRAAVQEALNPPPPPPSAPSTAAPGLTPGPSTPAPAPTAAGEPEAQDLAATCG